MPDNNTDNAGHSAGEFVYHTSREERLSYAYDNPNSNKKNCFFCRKNTARLILMADILIVLMIIAFYNYSVGRSMAIENDGALYYYSRKVFGNYDTQNFVIQIKNRSKKTVQLKSTEASFRVEDLYGTEIYSEQITITKTQLEKDEMFIKSISYPKLPSGKYKTVLTFNNNPEIVFQLYYQSK